MAPAFECRSCATPVAAVLYRDLPDRFLGVAGRFDYARCAGCGLVQLRNAPEDLGAYYAGYPVHARRSFVSRGLERILVGNCYLNEPGHGRSLLDVGCGNGDYLRLMASRGWRVTGYELEQATAARLGASGLHVVAGEVALSALPASFDLATFNFSFEHLERPLSLLDRVVSRLRPGGRVYIAVPNIEGRESALFKERWFHLDPPRHVTFFTKQLLRRALENRGFTAITTQDLPAPTGFAGSLSYRVWNRFEPRTYLASLGPGMLFKRIVGDGLFAITARLGP